MEQAGCRLYRVASGACLAQDSIVSFNTLRDPLTSPYKTGYRNQVGVNVSGGTEQIRYFLGADFDHQDWMRHISVSSNNR